MVGGNHQRGPRICLAGRLEQTAQPFLVPLEALFNLLRFVALHV